LFFENSACMNCQAQVGYCVETADLVALPDGVGSQDAPLELILSGGRAERFVHCKNFAEQDACNWLVKLSDQQPYCQSCRLTEVIPDLADSSNRAAWVEIERAKRRLLYTLYALKLPVATKIEDAEVGLTFRFLRSTETEKVMTGHNEGVVTLNIAEADAAFRENMREKMGEAYRTVLGHLRHEIGHYYWDRLIRNRASVPAFRKLFGDEQQSYQDAVTRHYEQGPPANWSESFISAYATMHPWEDWAETWAHYMHMVDTLETAKSHGLTVRIPGKDAATQVSTDSLAFRDFESLSAGWHAVTLALNNLNRSMGMKDVYPFVLSPPVQQKLRFVHDVIHQPPAKRAQDAGKDVAPPPAAPAPAAPGSKRTAPAAE
jgi:hypothetical protein